MHRATRVLVLTAGVLFAASNAWSATTYHWTAAGIAAWNTAGSWTPARSVPAADDILVFDGGGSVTATSVPTETIGQLSVGAGTSVALQSAVLPTLTIAGNTGSDLDVPSGCTLSMTGANPVIVTLGASATGTVGGTLSVSGGAHRVTAAAVGALHLQNGSLVMAGTGFTGNLFGTTSLNSVVFESGSIYSQSAGSNPFGAAQPNSVVTFQTGSRYRLDGTINPSFSGRTYADFEHNVATSTNTTGGNPFQCDNLIITQGTLNIGMTGLVHILGNITVTGATNLTFNPASANTYTLSGTSAQTITASGAFNPGANVTLEIDNPAGINLATNFALLNVLKFTNGKLNTSTHFLNCGTVATFSGASQGTGYVNGNLSWQFPAGTTTRTLPIGDATTHTPIDITINGAAGVFALQAFTTPGDHPNIATSGLDAAKTVNRSYSLKQAITTAITSFDATFQYVPADLDGAADPSSFQVERWDGASWNPTTIGTRTPTSTQITGETSFGEFAIGNVASTATLVSRFETESVSEGVVVRWQFGDATSVTASWVDRAEAGAGPWTRVTGPVRLESGVSTVVDIEAVAGRNYLYRLNVQVREGVLTFGPIAGVAGGITTFALERVGPNPMADFASIEYAVPRDADVRLSVVDLHGRTVTRLIGGMQAPGRHAVSWNGEDRHGRVPPGVYFIRFEAAGKSVVKRLIIDR